MDHLQALLATITVGEALLAGLVVLTIRDLTLRLSRYRPQSGRKDP